MVGPVGTFGFIVNLKTAAGAVLTYASEAVTVSASIPPPPPTPPTPPPTPPPGQPSITITAPPANSTVPYEVPLTVSWVTTNAPPGATVELAETNANGSGWLDPGLPATGSFTYPGSYLNVPGTFSIIANLESANNTFITYAPVTVTVSPPYSAPGKYTFTLNAVPPSGSSPLKVLFGMSVPYTPPLPSDLNNMIPTLTIDPGDGATPVNIGAEVECGHISNFTPTYECTGGKVIHTYNSPGSYLAKLTSNGTLLASQQVTVTSPVASATDNASQLANALTALQGALQEIQTMIPH
jgi:hypothetical protein